MYTYFDVKSASPMVYWNIQEMDKMVDGVLFESLLYVTCRDFFMQLYNFHSLSQIKSSNVDEAPRAPLKIDTFVPISKVSGI